MSEVTVKQLAEDVGIPLDLLLSQLTEAGLKKSGSDDNISEAEKMQLLSHLRESHGKRSKIIKGTPKKVTLKRKTVSELRQPSAITRTGGRSVARTGKTVSVEVRRKRTYVKRTELSEEDDQSMTAETARKLLDEQARKKRQIEAEDKARLEAEKIKKDEEEKKKRQAEEEKRARQEEEER